MKLRVNIVYKTIWTNFRTNFVRKLHFSRASIRRNTVSVFHPRSPHSRLFKSSEVQSLFDTDNSHTDPIPSGQIKMPFLHVFAIRCERTAKTGVSAHSSTNYTKIARRSTVSRSSARLTVIMELDVRARMSCRCVPQMTKGE